MSTTMGMPGGTKSLTNSPMLVGKARRAQPSSVGHGNLVYNWRDRHTNIYGLQQPPLSLNNGTDFGLNVPSQAANNSASHLIPISRDRRLSGSQHPGVLKKILNS